MHGPGQWLAALFALWLAIGAAAAQQPEPMPAPPAPAVMPGPRPPAHRIVLSEVVDPRYREAVLAVARKPTLASRAAYPEFVGTSAFYDWLLDHPDRVSLAWQRRKVPCVAISDRGNGTFSWDDGEGSMLTWQTVGRFADGLVWYATGKVKASAITPSVPVKAVVVMVHPKKTLGNGTVSITPMAQVYLQTDSKAAKIVLKLLGPSAPQLAEQGVEQLLFFFAGIAQYAQKHPDKSDALLAPARK